MLEFLQNLQLIGSNIFIWGTTFINTILSHWLGLLLLAVLFSNLVLDYLLDFIDQIKNKEYYDNLEQENDLKEKYYEIKKERFKKLMLNTIENKDLTDSYNQIKNTRIKTLMQNTIANKNIDNEYYNVKNKVDTFVKQNYIKAYSKIDTLEQYNKYLKEKYKKKNYKNEAPKPDWIDQDIKEDLATPEEIENMRKKLKISN